MSARPRPRAFLWAAILPLVVLGIAAWILEKGRSNADEREMRNAGRIVNGHLTHGGTAKFIEDSLRQHRPEVIVLGNSLANTDIQPALLARRLGLPPKKVQRYSVPNSLAPHWYAILKNRVYANGRQPRVVIVLSDLQSLVAVRPRSEASYLNLATQLGDSEPVIDAKLGRGNFWLERVRENRGRVRERSLTMVRNASINLLQNGTLSLEERARDKQALDRTFDDRNVDMRLHQQVIPIFQAQGHLTHIFDPETLPDPEDGFIGDITRLVSENGGTVIFLRPPMSPFLPSFAGDVVREGTEEQVADLAERHGGVFVDMRPLHMNAGHFYNLDHMNNEGGRRFTEALVQVFRELDLMGRRRGDPKRRNVEIELFTAVRVEGHLLVNQPAAAGFRGAVRAVPRAERPVNAGSKGARRFFDTSGALDQLSDTQTLKHTPFAARCSPLRVLEDGQELGPSNLSCKEVWEQKQGRSCHIGGKLYFSASDETDPLTNGRKYRLALDRERTCEGASWVYPGDKAQFEFELDDIGSMHRGAHVLAVEAVRMTRPEGDDGTVKFRLKVNGNARVYQELTLDELDTPHAWPIDPHIGMQARSVELVVSNASDSFVLVTSAVLKEREGRR